MKSSIIAAALCSTAALAAPYTAPLMARESNETANNLDLITKLQLAPTAVDRAALLTDDDWLYDFNAPPEGATTTGPGGHTVKADRKVFPALIGTGVSMTVGFLGPCGFNTPHTHPRSSEINIIVQGSAFTQFVGENGEKPVTNTLQKYQMTVFPRGATHMEFNPECEETVFVAGFASEDPGVEQSAQTLFELDPELVKADLGLQTIAGEDIENFKNAIPKNVALGIESCLKKCNIQKKAY
ncbi:RmlC-like cupin [Acrodontium crateriforme]|uniref:RmlC-like cupin n=1 Tax=Acrodontium crateriforme TaxID=150365 RepID=A0AAQ3LZX3_9PEZI|nr:RmlC-like cupin [Acrodontium crateriforme]